MSDESLLQALLAAEHAAVHAYGVLGARLEGDLLLEAQEADDAHRARRDRLAELLRARGAPVPGTLPAYDVQARTADDALGLAVRVEDGLALRWRDLVGGTDEPGLRRLGAQGLTDAAVRAARWRRAGGDRTPTVALPGTGAPGD